MFEALLPLHERKLQNTLKALQSYERKLITAVKAGLFLVTFGFILYKLIYSYKIGVLIHESQVSFSSGSAICLGLVVLLMGANWILETLKWKMLLNKNEPASFGEALKGVLSGVTLNIITPNQLGDFIGRILYLKRTGKVEGTLTAVIGHTAQVIMTLVFGLCGLLYILHYKKVINSVQYEWFGYLLIVCSAVLVLLYFNMALLAKVKGSWRLQKYLHVFTQYNRAELAWLLMVSMCRYAVFVLQYYLLTRLFMVQTEPVHALACITSAMCVQSFAPSFLLIELGMRGASALWFFGVFTREITPVLLTTYTLWMINVMLPGLAGMIFILKWRKTNG